MERQQQKPFWGCVKSGVNDSRLKATCTVAVVDARCEWFEAPWLLASAIALEGASSSAPKVDATCLSCLYDFRLNGEHTAQAPFLNELWTAAIT